MLLFSECFHLSIWKNITSMPACWFSSIHFSKWDETQTTNRWHQMSNRKLSKLILARKRILKSRYRHHLSTVHKTTWSWLCKHFWQPETWPDSRFSATSKHNWEPFIFCSHHHQVCLGKPIWSLKLHQLPCWLLPEKCQVPSVPPEISASAKWTVGDRIRA